MSIIRCFFTPTLCIVLLITSFVTASGFNILPKNVDSGENLKTELSIEPQQNMGSPLTGITIQSCDTVYYNTGTNCEAKIKLKNIATTTNNCTDSLMRWIVVIDMNDDGTEDWEMSTFLPVNNDISNAATGKLDLIRDDDGNGIPDVYLYPSVSGGELTVTFPGFVFGKDTKHRIYWKVFDMCQEVQRCEQIVVLKDNQKPIPYCINLKAELFDDPDGNGPIKPLVEMWALNFNIGSFDHCTEQENLFFTFDNISPQVNDTIINGQTINIHTPHYFDKNGAVIRYPSTNSALLKRYYEGELQLWIPQLKSSARVWTIDKIFAPGGNKGEIDVQMTVWDQDFNHDYCWVRLAALIHGEPGILIGGKINSQNEKNIRDIVVITNRNSPEYPKSTTTTQDGSYAIFTNLSVSASDNIKIFGHKNDDYTFGVSTLDLVQLSKHIQNISPFSNPYQFIAADVNNDQIIDQQDLRELRNVLLGLSESYTNNSWRFPVKNQTLDVAQVFPYQDTFSFLVMNHVDSLDFVGVKIGDINNSGFEDFDRQTTGSRNVETISFSTKDILLEKGKTYEIPVTSKDFVDIAGFQGTFAIHNLNLIDIKPGVTDFSFDNLGKENDGHIPFSYVSTKPATSAGNEILFTLVFQAKTNGLLSESFSVNATSLFPEVYTQQNDQMYALELRFDTFENPKDFVLFQNTPNPFRENTMISFFVHDIQQFEFRIFDQTAKQIYSDQITAKAGHNAIEFNYPEIVKYGGVFYYQLINAKYAATKKMVCFP